MPPGNNAILNLPNPGAAGSLSSNADLVIDGIAPFVSTDTRTYVLEASNPFGISDVGLSAKPTFADIDGDDDLDLFIGNRAGNTLFFRNTAASGSTAPAYAPAVTNPFGITDVGRAASPTLTDIDDDGDLDLFIGNRAGNTLFFRNNAAPGSTAPAYSQERGANGEPNPFGIPDVGFFSGPAFADPDNDNDADLFIGNAAGNTLFFRNTATPASSTPAYAPAVTNPFGITDVGRAASPTLTDIDGDGDLDLFIGNRGGNTVFFRNNAAPDSSDPALSQERGANGEPNPFGIPDVGFFSGPAFADPDNDSDPDLFIGNAAGTTLFFRNTGAAPGVNTSAINGVYTIGAVINLTIGFSEPVVVDTTGGTPKLSSSKPAPPIAKRSLPPVQAPTPSPSNTPFKTVTPPLISISSLPQHSHSTAAASLMPTAIQPSFHSLSPELRVPSVTMLISSSIPTISSPQRSGPPKA